MEECKVCKKKWKKYNLTICKECYDRYIEKIAQLKSKKESK